ncbi:MAG: histidine phosphatase family protein [Acidimicrobiales bacterium]|jgi:probable phosphoglycerate mutase
MPEPPGLWLVRHGETEWSASGRHTSHTDVPLTTAGEEQARRLSTALGEVPFQLVLSSPRQRARDTAELAGFRPEIDGDLAEWDYGDLEGLTIDQIRAHYPGWTIWTGPWPGGEKPSEVVARADRVLHRVLGLPDGARALVFAHGHVLRVLAARWLGLPGTEGRLFLLGTATVSKLGWEHGQPAVRSWNMPPAVLAARSL